MERGSGRWPWRYAERMKTRSAYIIPSIVLLAGCIIHARIVEPLKTQVVDAESGLPIAGAQVLRIVCDIHDFGCGNARVDRGQTNQDGTIEMKGQRKWGIAFPAPGGLPAPNHQIAVWKTGYLAFVFSQYGDFNSIKLRTKRRDLLDAIAEVPMNRKQYGPQNSEPDAMFSNGKVKLHRATAD